MKTAWFKKEHKEYYHTDGSLRRGDVCPRCGENIQGGYGTLGTHHERKECKPNPELLRQLHLANPQDGSKPRFRCTQQDDTV